MMIETAIDLFAGIGGFRVALQQAIPDAEVVFSSEIDPKCKWVYRKNFGENPEGDIRRIDAKDIPDHDLLMGGFPCQSFSIAGIPKLKSLGRCISIDNKKRGNLFFEIARILNVKKPKAFLLENVPTLENIQDGSAFRIIKDTLKKIGYVIYWKVLDARNFGLPQMRKRIFIVGFRDGWLFKFPEGYTNSRPTIQDILEDEVFDQYTLTDETWERLKAYKKKQEAKGNGFGYQMIDPDGCAYTLVAHYGQDPYTNIYPQEDDNPRRLTPRECARLQGFPEDFVLHPSDTKAWKQLGNSIPVPVVSEIIKRIQVSLQKKKKKKLILDYF